MYILRAIPSAVKSDAISGSAPAFPTHRDAGSVRRCREHRRTGIPAIHGHRSPKIAPAFPAFAPSMALGNCSCISDPQGCGKCPQVPGASADRHTGHPWPSPKIAPAFSAYLPSMATKKDAARRRRQMLRDYPAISGRWPADTSTGSSTSRPKSGSSQW